LIHIVGVERAEIDFFPSALQIDLGVLPVGTYRIELALRVRNADGTLGPETLRSAFDLVVGEVSRACTPASIVADAYYLTTRVGTAFGSPLSVRVLDKEQRPVAGAVVHFSRIARPEEAIAPDLPAPDATLNSESATTDADGVAQVTAIANGVVGSYHIVARVFSRVQGYRWIFVLSNRDDAMTTPVVPVVEYGGFKYFYTSNPAEMIALDRTPGWGRTGAVFLAFPTGSSSQGFPSRPVCRYMGLPAPAPYSHFFSLDPYECDAVGGRYPAVWLFEAENVFEALVPNPATGECAGGSVPLYRMFATLFDGISGPSHRFTTSTDFQAWLTLPGRWPGFVAEGAGPGVVMCVLP
jgi:hypothetical protein